MHITDKHEVMDHLADEQRKRAEQETRAARALLADELFLKGDPNRIAHARRIVRIVLSAALILATILLHAATAHASMPSEDAGPRVTYCVDRDELAGVTNAEAGAQRRTVQLTIMQIFVKEAESRGITFCALSHLTRFSGVRYYVRLHPGSYLEWRLNNPPEDLILMADDVLLHRYPDMTEGAGHWDGDGQRIVFRP